MFLSPSVAREFVSFREQRNATDITRIGMNMVAPLKVASTSSVSMEQR